MSFQSQMGNGYPAEGDIDSLLDTLGIEIMTENNPNWYAELKQTVWGLLNSWRWASALGVWLPDSTTFNVRGGPYRFAGQVKTYSPGAAVDPTDNDTTYIWMAGNNTIGSGVDGSGWPAAEHLKLAEIDVDADGVITDVRDMRGKNFPTIIGGGDLGELSETDHSAVPIVLGAEIVSGSTVQVYNSNAPYKLRVIDAWSIAASADGGTWKLTNGASDITDTVTVTGTDKAIDRAGAIDDDYSEIAAGGSLSVVGDGVNADCDVYIQAIRVS